MIKFVINVEAFIPTRIGWKRKSRGTNQSEESGCKILFPLFFLFSEEEFSLNQKLLLP
jgi:hypothetical protein